MIVHGFCALSLSAVAVASAGANDGQRRHADQIEALKARRDGRILPVREIEHRVLPHMKGAQYLGFDFDSGSNVYTLKFLRNGSVIWVDVDGRTGHIIGRTDQ